MCRLHSTFAGVAILIAFCFLGCQGEAGDPTGPDLHPSIETPGLSASSSVGMHHCLGYYLVIVDTETREVEVVHLRSGELHLNLTEVLNATMGVSAVSVPAEADPANGLFVFDITLTHPFGTKKQLAGFDVKGILMTPGSLNVDSQVFADVDETRLENADGYTRWWNPTEFTAPGMFGYTKGNLANAPASALTATVNPYKLYGDGLDATTGAFWMIAKPLDDGVGRAVFTAGSSNVRRYYIRFPMAPGPQVVFGYAVDACWAKPTPNPPDEIPDDFPMEANQPEACFMHFEPIINTLFYDSESGTAGGVLRMICEVYDWQGRAAGNIAGELSSVGLLAPELFSGEVAAVFVNENQLRASYSADLSDIAVPTQPGEILMVMKGVSSDGSTYDQGVGSAPTDPIAAWKAWPIDITDPECEVDDNNSHNEAEDIYVSDPVSGNLCGGVDDEDWYRLDIFTGYRLEGEIRFYCDAPSSGVIFHDTNGLFLAGADVIDGVGSIDLDVLDLGVGEYFINVFTSSMSQAVIYLLEIDGDFIDIKPMLPIDVTPSDLFLDVDWTEKLGNYILLQGYFGFWVLDVSDSLDPVIVSRVYDMLSPSPTLVFPYLYYWESENDNPAGIDLIDYSDPANPIHYEDVLTISNNVHAMTGNSDTLYVAVSDGVSTDIYIYDIAVDPTNPQEVSHFNVNSVQRRLALIDPEGPETVLVTMTNTFMGLYDVEDPYNVTLVGANMLLSGIQHDIAIEQNYILKAFQDGANNGYINITSYSSGSGLSAESTVYVPGEALFVDTAGMYAYVGSGTLGLQVVDFTTPSAATWVTFSPTVSNSRHVYAEDGIVVNIPDHAGYTWYDISNPLSPVETYRYMCLNNPVDAAIVGDHAYFAEYGDPSYTALKVVNVSDGSKAYVEAEYLVDDTPWPIAGLGDIVAMGQWNDSDLLLFDVSDPTNPQLQMLTNYTDQICSLAITDSAVYSALTNGFLEILDISAFPIVVPKTPVNILHEVSNLTVSGDYMYGHSGPDVYVYDISNPYVPAPAGSYTPLHEPEDLSIVGKSLYILTTDTLEIADITTPTAPAFISDLAMPYAPTMKYIAMDGQFAYVTDTDVNCVVAVSTWPPDSPSIFNEIHPGAGWYQIGIAIAEGYLYELQYIEGVRITDLY